MARILSLLVALVTAVAGQALLFWSAYPVTQLLAGSGQAVVGAALASVAGVLLQGVSVLTAAWSSLGTWTVGLIQSLVGLAAVVAGGPLVTTLRDLRLSNEADEGLHWYLSGTGLATGAITVAVGAAIRHRRRVAASGGWAARLISLLVLLLAIGPSTLLALSGGLRNQNATLSRLGGPDALGLVLLLVGTLLLVVLATTVRWSGLGAIIGGASVAVIGLSIGAVPAVAGGLSVAPEPIVGGLSALPGAVGTELFQVLGSGVIPTIGVLFLFGGIASVIAGRGVHHRATWVEPVRTDEVPPAS